MTVATGFRINVGCGDCLIDDYVNIDERDPSADIIAHVPPLSYQDGMVDEVWACHFLEHLSPSDAAEFLHEAYRVLVPGGELGIVVPDTREIMRRYIDGEKSIVEFPEETFRDMRDLDEIGAMFLYSTAQDSPHLWSYDETTLRRTIEAAGFQITGRIDRYKDPRLGLGAWYQCGWSAVKPS